MDSSNKAEIMENQNDQVVRLLEEIRDTQRESLLALREQAKIAFDLQQITATRQKRQVMVYYLALVIILPLFVYISYRVLH